MSRKSLPHRIEDRRKKALERRLIDVSKYSSEKDSPKLYIAKNDIKNLKTKLGIKE